MRANRVDWGGGGYISVLFGSGRYEYTVPGEERHPTLMEFSTSNSTSSCWGPDDQIAGVVDSGCWW